MGGLAAGQPDPVHRDHTRTGVPVDDTATPFCYPNYTNPANGCRPDLRSYADPHAGRVGDRGRGAAYLAAAGQPVQADATALGATFDPAVLTVAGGQGRHRRRRSRWKVTNGFAPVDGQAEGRPARLGRGRAPTIAEGDSARPARSPSPEGASRLDVAIGGTSDTAADLDLTVFLRRRAGRTVRGRRLGGGGEPRRPGGRHVHHRGGRLLGPGRHHRVRLPRRVLLAVAGLGHRRRGGAGASWPTARSANVAANVLVAAPAPEGRQFFGEVQLLNADGTAAGTGSVLIEKVNAG